jgi:hypothetical protein
VMGLMKSMWINCKYISDAHAVPDTRAVLLSRGPTRKVDNVNANDPDHNFSHRDTAAGGANADVNANERLSRDDSTSHSIENGRKTSESDSNGSEGGDNVQLGNDAGCGKVSSVALTDPGKIADLEVCHSSCSNFEIVNITDSGSRFK